MIARQTYHQETVLDTIKEGHPVRNADISSLVTADGNFAKRVSFVNCIFQGMVDFSRSRFERGVSFVGCSFLSKVCFVACWVQGDCEFRAVKFNGSANFDRMFVDGKLEIRAPSDDADIRALMGEFKDAPFARFYDMARFSQIRVTGEVNLGSAQFHRWANFYDARIGGSVLLRIDREKGDKGEQLGTKFPPARFHGGVRFRAAQIGGELNLYGAQFWGTTDFSYVTVRGATFFCDPEIHPSRHQDASTFCQFHAFPLWRPGTLYKDGQPADVSDVHDVMLEERLKCPEAEPNRSRILTKLRQTKKLEIQRLRHGNEITTFQSEELLCRAEFDAARFVGGLAIRGEIFGRPSIIASFRDTTYSRLEMRSVDSRECFDYLISVITYAEEHETNEFERTAWIQLETTLRRIGKTHVANAVYRKRMSREVRWDAPHLRLWRWLWGVLSGYGTWPGLVVAWCITVITVFALIYLHYRHIEPYPNAFAKSVARFTPFPLSLAPVWPEEYDPAGAVERLFGWFLVPALAASLIGILERRAKDEKEIRMEAE